MDALTVQPCRAVPRADDLGPENNKPGYLGRRKWPLERPEGENYQPSALAFASSSK